MFVTAKHFTLLLMPIQILIIGIPIIQSLYYHYPFKNISTDTFSDCTTHQFLFLIKLWVDCNM